MIATRRNAACSSASRSTCPRASALAIAVAMISAKFESRSSASAGRGSPAETVAAPQSRPSTWIGLATVEATPSRSFATDVEPSLVSSHWLAPANVNELLENFSVWLWSL